MMNTLGMIAIVIDDYDVAISHYVNDLGFELIENKEKKTGKSTDYVKVHETEKNNYSLLSTSRRCKLLQDALPNDVTIVPLKYDSTLLNKKFDFKISKKQFEYDKQSASNNCISDEQINTLCRNISSIKVSLKDLITLVYNKFVNNFEQYTSKLESIVNFVTLIDVLYTKSSLAKKYNYCKPNIIKSDKCSNCRNGLVELKTEYKIVIDKNNNDYARTLYSALRQGDTLGIKNIYAVPAEDFGVGIAINDRLKKAAHNLS